MPVKLQDLAQNGDRAIYQVRRSWYHGRGVAEMGVIYPLHVCTHNELMIGPCPTDASESGSRSAGSSQDSAKNKWAPLSVRRISPPSDVKVQ